MDNISSIIILRALFVFSLIDKGWSVKKSKYKKNTFEMYKTVQKNENN